MRFLKCIENIFKKWSDWREQRRVKENKKRVRAAELIQLKKIQERKRAIEQIIKDKN